MKTLRILWLTTQPHPRENSVGATWLSVLLPHLARRPTDLELTVLSTAPHLSTPVERFERDGIRYIYLDVPPPSQDIRSLYRHRVAILANYMRQHYHEYDLVHIHGSESQLHTAMRGLPVPALLSVQGIVWECLKVLPWFFEPTRTFLWGLASYYELRYLRYIRHVSCRTTWDTYHSRRLSPGCQVHLNWEMIRPAFFELNCAAEQASRPASTEPPRLLFMGGTQVMKGFREVLQAFNLVRQQQPAKLVVVGETNPAWLSRYIRRTGLTAIQPDDLDIRGRQSPEDLRELMRDAHCLLHPSYIDNSPNTICEAQVAGLPVVASRVGGVGSLLEHEQTGLFSSLKPRDIADQILRLCQDESLRQRLARQARQVARRRHDPVIITQRTIEIYRTILAGEPPALWPANTDDQLVTASPATEPACTAAP